MPMGPPDSKKPRRSILVKFSLKGDKNDGGEKDNSDNESKERSLESSGDTLFDPCAEMMIHDFDDERTLDEEEALETNEDPQTELSDLQKESDMPLNELLAMYGYSENSGGDDDDNVLSGTEEELKDPLRDDVIEDVREPSQLAQLYSDLNASQPECGSSSRLLRSVSRPQSDEEEDDGDYSPEEEEWKKTIMVGSDYQAKIPFGFCKYDDALPYENDDKMLWDPSAMKELDVKEFLATVQECSSIQLKDDEQALYLLLQCGFNVDEALRRRRINSVAQADNMSIWSEEECRNFETGMRLHGKDFHAIQKNKVRTRSVGELVQFYYLWKKTERHDVYAHKTRLEKKKYSLHPGITDYMDRFLEEQDAVTSPGSHMASADKSDSVPSQDPLQVTSIVKVNSVNAVEESEEPSKTVT